MDPSYKLHYVWLAVALTPRLNYKKSLRRLTKQMILYRSTERSLYHLVLVVGGWLAKRLKIFEKLAIFALIHGAGVQVR